MDQVQEAALCWGIQQASRTNAFINCGEVCHVFNDCPKPKPKLLESIIDSAIPIARPPISELPFVINLKTDDPIDSTEHHLNDARVISLEIDLYPKQKERK